MGKPSQRLKPRPTASTRRRLVVSRHRSTTNNVCCLYPATVQASLPPIAPILGIDRSAGDAPLYWDPFAVYDAGLVTNPNVFVMGEPGYAKSSLIKCWCYWQYCLWGLTRWVTFTDPKGEYRPLAELMGMSVVRLEPGGRTRINPLESPRGLSAEEAADDRTVQSTLLAGMAGTQLHRPLTQLERKMLRMVIDVLNARRGPTSPTLPDVVALLTEPNADMCAATVRDVVELVRDTEELRFCLDELCTGPLAGMFDGPSTVSVDWSGPGVVMDLSGVVDDDRAMPLVMSASMSWTRQQKHHLVGRQVTNINDESYYMYKRAETVEFAQSRRKLGRQFGEANIDICHRPSDLGSQADDGSAVSKMAAGLIKDTSMRIIFRQAPDELEAATHMLGLTETERACIARLKRGRALWKINDWSLLARHHRPDVLHHVTDTDGRMRRASLLDVDPATELAVDDDEAA